MKDIFIFNNGRLKRTDATIQFIDADGKKKTLPIVQVENIHLFGEIDMNTSFLNLLTQQGVVLHTYNYYGYYSGSFIPRSKQVSGYIDVRQAAHILDSSKRIFVAKQFIYGAVHHMLKNIRQHKEGSEVYINTIESERENIESAKTIPELMGMEGNIRKIYYQAFNHMIKNEFFHFVKREKRPPKDPINALISFGNSIMYTTILSELYKTQLNPTMSFLHEPSVKRYSLSLDLAEIFKPLIIDGLIVSLINNRVMKSNHFEYIESEICFLNDEGKKIFLKAYEERLSKTIKHRTLKRQTSYRFLIRLECYKLIKHIIGDKTYRPLKAWW